MALGSREESWGVVELVKAMLVQMCMYKLTLCMVLDVRTITTRIQAKQHKFGDI